MSDHGARLDVGGLARDRRAENIPEARMAYGDDRCGRGRAYWVLWSVETGRWSPQRYASWAEADAAREGHPDQMPCLQYAWGPSGE